MMTILLKAGLRAQNSANKNLNTNLATNATIKFYLRIFLFLLNWWKETGFSYQCSEQDTGFDNYLMYLFQAMIILKGQITWVYEKYN